MDKKNQPCAKVRVQSEMMEGDWELIHGSDTESTDSNQKSGTSGVIDDGMILSDHFSSDYLPAHHSQSGVVESGDYGSEPQNPGFDQLNVSQSDDVCARNELRFDDPESEASDVEEPIEDLSKSCSDSGGNEPVSQEEEIVSDSGIVAHEAIEGRAVAKGRESVWWKMPFALLKYCAFKVGPAWSVSMAAALMGFFLLGRRLYNMKKKAQAFHLKVTIDDKKASRVMIQAAQLNQAFTEVRRVPVIRPALPSPGSWPLLSLR